MLFAMFKMLFWNNYLKPVVFENSKEVNRKSNCKYACKYCDKKFAHLSSLKAHETIHTGKNYYCCKNCDYSAATLTSLKKHESTHNQGSIDNISMHGLSNSVLERSNP